MDRSSDPRDDLHASVEENMDQEHAALIWPRNSYEIPNMLHSLNLQNFKASFDEHNVTDLWLQIPKQTLRRFFNNAEKENAFYELQRVMFFQPRTDPWWALNEDVEDCCPRHSSFEDGDDYVQRRRILGEGAFGTVEEVALKNRTSEVICVRKSIARPKNLGAHQKVMDAFYREMKVMNQVDHHHCVRFLQTYVDLESVNILLSPVADMDLGAYMEQDLDWRAKTFLQRSIRCLCNAMKYLHEKKIRHEDLKPQNILVHGDNVLLADFGCGLDFSDDSISTTTGRPAAWTIRYAAPEVLEFEPRNRASDVFSLGCVIIEIISAYNGHKLSEIKEYWRQNGTRHPSFAQNREAMEEWLTMIQAFPQTRIMEHLCMFVSDLMLPDRRARCTASLAVDRLAESDALMFGDHEASWFGDLKASCCPGDHSVISAAMHIAPMLREDKKGSLFLPYCFYPSSHPDWAWLLFSSSNEPHLLASNVQYNVPAWETIGDMAKKPSDIIQVFSEIWNEASRDGHTKEYWDACALQPPMDMEDLTENDIQALMLATRSIRLKYIVFQAWWMDILLPPGRDGEERVEKRTLMFLCLVPITDRRSRLYGHFVFQLVFQLDQSNSIPDHYLNRVIDLTIT